MEMSILIGAIGFLAVQIFSPAVQMKVNGETIHNPINKYFGEELVSDIDFKRVKVSTDYYGTFSVVSRNVITYCGDHHWQKVNQRNRIIN